MSPTPAGSGEDRGQGAADKEPTAAQPADGLYIEAKHGVSVRLQAVAATRYTDKIAPGGRGKGRASPARSQLRHLMGQSGETLSS